MAASRGMYHEVYEILRQPIKPASSVPPDIAVLLTREGSKHPHEINWAKQAKSEATLARRAARIASKTADIATPVASPRRALVRPTFAPAATPSPRGGLAPSKMLERDLASREAHAARQRAHRLLDEAESSPFRAAGFIDPALHNPPAAKPTRPPQRARPELASPRVPCVQAGHREILEGRFADAEPVYRDALARKEAALGPTNPSTLSSLVSLADLLVLQARHAEAVPLYWRALEGVRDARAVATKLARALRVIEREEQAIALEARFGIDLTRDDGAAGGDHADALQQLMAVRLKVADQPGDDGSYALTLSLEAPA